MSEFEKDTILQMCLRRLKFEYCGNLSNLFQLMPYMPPVVYQHPYSPSMVQPQVVPQQIFPQMPREYVDLLNERVSIMYKIFLIKTALCVAIDIEYQNALDLQEYLSLEYNDKINVELLQERDNLVSLATDRFRDLENKLVAGLKLDDDLPYSMEEVDALLEDMKNNAKEKFSAIVKKSII